MNFDVDAEWLEADGLGGFASGTVAGIRTRRYHALLLTATTPPAGRMVLVNGFDAWIETMNGSCAISSQRYAPDVIHPDGAARIEQFEYEPWPRWRYRISDEVTIEHELFVAPGQSAILLSWKLFPEQGLETKLKVRPFLSGRDFHSTHHENNSFRFTAGQNGERVIWHPYDGVPAVLADSNGRYLHEPAWYRNFFYTQEAERGLDAIEDLASPGTFEFTLSNGPAVLMLSAEGHASQHESIETLFALFKTGEQMRRKGFATPLDRAADAYIVKRGEGKTLIAGYPWFGDWGRDTFIALRGLCIATGRLDEARDILMQWAGVVSQGMLPNRFPDRGEEPEFNSVDASLWYVIAVHDYLEAAGNDAGQDKIDILQGAVEAILSGYFAGTRFGIRADEDGLLSAGEAGQQLTWMDARVEGREITARIGKPVEIQALWLNALAFGAQFSARWEPILKKARAAFEPRFWNEERGHLADVVDCNHKKGDVDLTFRPNQIFAVGGLRSIELSPEKAKRLVDAVEKKLLTPLGLRSLAPGEPSYTARYCGTPAQRDGCYHQGTVWPWLLGPFVEAWVRVRGETDVAKTEARKRFLAPLFEHLNEAGLGHISEIADAEAPFKSCGCPFQAWSLGELLRLDRVVLK
ncbi:MAG: hypothetical protein QOI04_1431 [Verrucomicrobiota bacterium]|jgi:predicted glycogen debranching enzyme